MVGYILIDPNQVHSYREFEEDHELMEALDNYYSMQCFAAENRFIDISTNENVTTKDIFENTSSWFRTYMLTDETRNGKWIGFIEFYNPELKSVANYYADLVAFKTLIHFFEDVHLANNSKYKLLKRAIYLAMNMVLNKYESMPLDIEEFSLESLKREFEDFFGDYSGTIKNPEMRHQFWNSFEAILENCSELKQYYYEELSLAYQRGNFKREMYVKTYLDDRYLEPRVSREEIIANIFACEEEYLLDIGPENKIIDGNEIDHSRIHISEPT
ncbi:MAG: hypothetical protein K2I70_04960, partial [Bacilli bacterium]|nr:hypothetical protein [Bacilli bacterium]